MSGEIPNMPKGDDTSKRFFAALLTAAQSTCTCETVKILKGMADSMKKEFME